MPGPTTERGAGADAGDTEATGRRLRASHGFVSLGVAAAIVAVLGGVLFGSGNADHLVELLPGRAWVANDDRGSITLVNGATGTPEFEMRFKDAAGDEFEVVQGDEGVFVVNRTTGEITRIDGATQSLGASIQVDVGDEPLFVIGGGRAYLVLRALGTVQEIDPESPNLAPIGDPVPLGTAIGSAVVDDRGVLAAAVLGSGEVVFVEGASVAGRVAINAPGDPLTVTIVDGRVVAVAQDLGRNEVEVATVGPNGVQRSQNVAIPATGELAIAPKMDGDRLWLLHRDTATLVGAALDADDVRTLALDFAKGDELGAPLPNGSFVYVPSFDQGALFKVDASTGAFVDVIPVGEDAEEFDAFVENGRVWGNDPIGGTAIVIDRDGNVQRVEKYQPGVPTNEGIDTIAVADDDVEPSAEPGGPPDVGPGTDPTRTAPDGDGAADRGIPLPIEPIDPIVVVDPIVRADPAVPGAPTPPTDPGARTSVPAPGGPTAPTAPGTDPPDNAPSAGVPGAPGGVSAAAGDGEALVSWLPALDNGSILLRYRVTASTGGTETVDAPASSLTFTGLTNGTPVSFTVHAENAIGAGPGATSNTISPAYTVPGPPTDVAFALTQPDFFYAAVTATWDAPTENPDAVAEYHIRCTASGNPTPYEFTAPSAARTRVLSLPYDADYFCGIQARAVDGSPSPDVTMASGTTLRPFDAPPPPDSSDCRSVPGSTSGFFRVQCTLTPPTGTDPITGFIFEVHDGVQFVFQRPNLAPTAQVVTSDTDIPTGTGVLITYCSYYTDPVSGLTVVSEPNSSSF